VKLVSTKLFSIVLVLAALLVAVPAIAQNNPASTSVYSGGIYYSAGYSQWSNTVTGGVAASGTTITVASGSVILLNGREVVPFGNSSGAYAPITVGLGTTQETVTPTSVSGCVKGGPSANFYSPCTITVSGGFTNAHNAGEPVYSGDQGIMEAINDAASNGGGLVYWTVDTGAVTLTTSGLTTTTTTMVPTFFMSMGAAARVTTTITTSANWAVGISGSTSAFCTANSTLTAGTTCLANQNAPAKVGSTNALTAVLFTMGTSNPGAGAIHAHLWGLTPVQPSF
jgi:hypothetical protein